MTAGARLPETHPQCWSTNARTHQFIFVVFMAGKLDSKLDTEIDNHITDAIAKQRTIERRNSITPL